MNQKFYEEVSSMSETKAKKLLALFNEDKYTQKLIIDYFEGKGLPFDPVTFKTSQEDRQLLAQAIQFLRHKATIHEESDL